MRPAVVTLALVLLTSATPAAAAPEVTQRGTLQAPASGIAAGPDGALWHTSSRRSARVGRTTLGGQTTEWSVAGAAGDVDDDEAEPGAITRGPDGALWFVDASGSVGRVTVSGVNRTVRVIDEGTPKSIAAGSDGNLWFTVATKSHKQDGAIGRMTPAGELTLFDDGLSADPHDIAVGWDGAMWFTEPGDGGRIGRITPSGQITEFRAGLTPGREPTGIIAAYDGAMWFTERNGTGAIGRIALDGRVTEYTVGLPPGLKPEEITLGPDAALWFTHKNGVGRITTPGAITTYATAGMDPTAITAGADGAIWLADRKHAALGRISLLDPAFGAVAAPRFGHTVVARPQAGVVRVKAPGRKRFKALSASTNVPVGSLVDSRRGRVRLRTAVNRAGASQTGTFHGGLFKVRQPADGGGIVKIVLRGRLDCRAKRSLATTSRRRRYRRRVWGVDLGGLFQTLGLGSVTTVRGTRWLTEDRCGGTLTKVVRGSVVVRDRATGKRFVLHAGERHFARRKR